MTRYRQQQTALSKFELQKSRVLAVCMLALIAMHASRCHGRAVDHPAVGLPYQ